MQCLLGALIFLGTLENDSVFQELQFVNEYSYVHPNVVSVLLEVGKGYGKKNTYFHFIGV